jgi:hypothetical protein
MLRRGLLSESEALLDTASVLVVLLIGNTSALSIFFRDKPELGNRFLIVVLALHIALAKLDLFPW